MCGIIDSLYCILCGDEKMSLDFKLIKFTNYAEELLKGNIYLNSLEYYRGIERVLSGETVDRNTAINDYLEGSVASINKEDLKKIGMDDFYNAVGDALVGNVHLLSEGAKYLKIFCLYALLFDDENNIAFAPSQKMLQFASKYAVIITDIEEFRKRIIDSLELQEKDFNIISMQGGFVEYYDNDEKNKILGPLHKTSDFWWQHEFRMIFTQATPDVEPVTLQIGDISDIAFCVEAETLINNPNLIFKEYEFIPEADN